MKAIIFDSSTLISLTMNGLLNEFKSLKKIFDGKFIITKEVKKEVVDKPLTIEKFKLEALHIQELLREKVLEMPDSLNVNDSDIAKKTAEILNIANNTFFSNNNPMKIIEIGEASCLALSKILVQKGVGNIIAVDERTTRVLGEKPDNLKKFFQKKFHTRIDVKKENYKYFEKFRFIRSTELMYVAYKKDLVELKEGKEVLDAMLYALRFKGCSISDEEINEMKRL